MGMKKAVPAGTAFYAISVSAKFADAEAGFTQMVHRVGIRDAHVPFAALTERVAGHDRDLFLFQQAFAERFDDSPVDAIDGNI